MLQLLQAKYRDWVVHARLRNRLALQVSVNSVLPDGLCLDFKAVFCASQRFVSARLRATPTYMRGLRPCKRSKIIASFDLFSTASHIQWAEIRTFTDQVMAWKRATYYTPVWARGDA